MLQIFYYFLLLINIFYAGYFLFSLLGLIKKEKRIKKTNKESRYAILIAARNEEKVIGNLIDSLNNQNYSKNKFEIFVLINNCTDLTKKISLNKKATIIECNNVKNKAEVLKNAFSYLKKRTNIDAYIVFDADNVVNKDFLMEMNKEIQNGTLVGQGYRDSKNYKYNWLSTGYSLFYYIQNLFFTSRSKQNLSSVINGTGFMIKKEIIDKIGYNMKTFTEDMELSAILTLNNIKINFVKKAITYDEQPIKFSISWKQRKRWTTGCYQCLKEYGLKLFQKMFKKDIAALDLFVIFFSPLLQVITTSVFIINIIYVIYKYGFLVSIINGIILSLLSYICIVIFAILMLKYNKKDINKLKIGILLFPIFLLSWLPIQFICLFKHVKTWETIEHTIATDIGQLE